MLFNTSSFAESKSSYYNEALNYIENKDYENAFFSIQKHILNNPDDTDGYYIKSEVLGNLNRYDDAIDAIDVYLNENPLNQDAQYTKGKYLYNLQKYEESIKVFDIVISLGDNYFYAYIYKIKALSSIDKHDESLLLCDEAILIYPDFAEIYYTKGLILGKNKEYSKALDEFNKSINKNKEFMAAYFGKSLALEYLGKINESKEAFMDGYKISPEFGYKILKSIDTSIILKINNPNMYFGGSEFEIDPGRKTTPVIKENRTLLPIRVLIETLGGSIQWFESEKKVLITYQDKEISLYIDKYNFEVNGEKKILDAAPTIINSRTMIPIRFLAENIGFDVYWYDKEESVIVTKFSIKMSFL